MSGLAGVRHPARRVSGRARREGGIDDLRSADTANAAVQFIGRPALEPELVLQPRVIRKSSAAECIGITAMQDDWHIFDSTFWFIGDSESAQPYAQRGDVGADPRTLESVDVSSKGLVRWDNVVERFPVLPYGAERAVLDPPVGREWFKLGSGERLDDPVLAAAYLLIMADAAPWLAMNWGLPPISRGYVRSTVTLSVQFIAHAVGEYLLVSGEGVGIRHDAYAGAATLWAEDGRLLAMATQDNVVRARKRLPAHPDQTGLGSR